jgi:predicted lipid-binding transport protein (Tim44 family)
MAPLAGLAAGGLIAGLLFGGLGHGLGDRGLPLLLVGGGLVVLLMSLRRRPPRAQRACATLSVASGPDTPPDRTTTGDNPNGGSSFEQGVRDIRRTDPGFDPARFAGYTGMVFRDAQAAWMTRDLEPLRGRVTPEMYGELQAQCDGLRDTGHANRVEQIEITTEITEAWQENGRDYVTASIAGSIIDYTLDEVGGGLVHGSRTVPRAVEEFWTFTRPAGFNFWRLSAVQNS